MQSMWKGTVTASCNLLQRHVLGWCKGFHKHIILVVCARMYEYYFIRQLALLPLRPFLITAKTIGHAPVPFCRESGSTTFSSMWFR